MFVHAKGRYGIALTRRPISRPHDRSPMTFACPGCDVIYADGVAYDMCPACDLPLDWVRLDLPVWCCAGCDRMINAELEQVPYCERCGRNMVRIDESLAWPAPPRNADIGAGVLRPLRSPLLSLALDCLVAAVRWVGYVLLSVLCYGVLALALFGPILTMALDPKWRLLAMAMLAPVLLLPLILGGAVLWNLVGVLGELRDLARDRVIRVLHGLEHATIKILAEQGIEPDGGITHQGFFRLHFSAYRAAAYGEARCIKDAAREAIQRVKRGETGLALHPQCGTSQLVAITLLSLMAVGSTAVGLFFTVDGWVLAIGLVAFVLLMALGARRLGILAQRLLTVSTEFRSAELLRVIRHMTEDGNTVYYDVLVDVDVGARAVRGGRRSSRR